MIDWKKYLIVFLITLGIFGAAFLLSNYFNDRKVQKLEDIYQRIATNVLSTETKFSLLRFASCEDIVSDTTFENELTRELGDMARRVKYMESQLGVNNEDVLLVKTQYSLLQIKDYLLVRELAARCKEKVSVILYFHDLDCEDCSRQSLVLDEISELYPKVRVYWLDRSLETPAMQTISRVFSIKETPAIVIEGKTYTGFKTVAELEEILLKEKLIKKTEPSSEVKEVKKK
ncbi:hypothetical protein A2645_00045 [Candidatus Nomurabacteria bacterium RIFCSPHIGHO2_01_FULL_39_9]|uniref:Thioredoxin domain-containing protein n=1 Tax=Candidatus Nomurabacteria bacterium RIFCSPHIGHO2_01_FULL_39_9 TaxID=1801735 RepID=A0A1F6UVK1_9BACT|nr:MAG: hypothetical protein A2645_00045 [Candidatus Nomurabacteria bacterium RIFCSPHIGHO2_01_FULL_39_9]